MSEQRCDALHLEMFTDGGPPDVHRCVMIATHGGNHVYEVRDVPLDHACVTRWALADESQR